MKNASIVVGLVLFLAVLVAPGSAQSGAPEKYEALEVVEWVTIVDVKGVTTEATGFGKLFGPGHISGYRGASEVQVPFDRIVKLTTGKIVDNRMQVDILLYTGRELPIVVDRPEYETAYGGTADFGYFRLRLQDIRVLTFHREDEEGQELGQRCGGGHIFYNQSWRFCPYCGDALVPLGPPK